MGGLQGTDAFNKNISRSGDRRDSKIDLVLELIGADYGGQMLLKPCN
jgi:hypothetical protein